MVTAQPKIKKHKAETTVSTNEESKAEFKGEGVSEKDPGKCHQTRGPVTGNLENHPLNKGAFEGDAGKKQRLKC